MWKAHKEDAIKYHRSRFHRNMIKHVYFPFCSVLSVVFRSFSCTYINGLHTNAGMCGGGGGGWCSTDGSMIPEESWIAQTAFLDLISISCFFTFHHKLHNFYNSSMFVKTAFLVWLLKATVWLLFRCGITLPYLKPIPGNIFPFKVVVDQTHIHEKIETLSNSGPFDQTDCFLLFAPFLLGQGQRVSNLGFYLKNNKCVDSSI